MTALLQYVGTTEFARLQFEMLLEHCVEEAEKYELPTDPEKNYTNPYGDLIPKICQSDCSGNGICKDGSILY